MNPPSGCPFQTRCPRKIGAICEEQMPPLKDFGNGHRILCHIDDDVLKSMEPVIAMPGDKDKGRKATAKTDISASSGRTKAAAAAAALTAMPAPVKAKSAAKKAVKKAAKAPAAKASGPVRLKKPEGKADDLKLISGVGPKLEQTLNKLGFWHFSQIAKWTKKDIAIVDDELSFKGRIERDDWVKQAKALAKKTGR
jgi:peptide/nickel transport system ATP-binding protein